MFRCALIQGGSGSMVVVCLGSPYTARARSGLQFSLVGAVVVVVGAVIVAEVAAVVLKTSPGGGTSCSFKFTNYKSSRTIKVQYSNLKAYYQS